MEYILDSIRGDWQTFLRFGPRIIYGLVLLAIFLLAAKFGGRLVANILARSAQFRSNAHFLRNLVTSGIDIMSAPDFRIEVLAAQPTITGESR